MTSTFTEYLRYTCGSFFLFFSYKKLENWQTEYVIARFTWNNLVLYWKHYWVPMVYYGTYKVFKKFFKLLICYLTFLWNISSRCTCQRIINFCLKRKYEFFQKGIKSADLFSKFSWNISSHSRRRRITKRSDPTGFSPFCG